VIAVRVATGNTWTTETFCAQETVNVRQGQARNEIRTETACHTISIEACRAYKPSAPVYHYVSQKLGAAARMMVAAHVWDTVGAQGAGFNSALITRARSAPVAVPACPNRISSFPI
jgi:hypothetical protein